MDPAAATRARELVQALRAKHPVSDRFAAECCTAVETIFSEFDGSERERLLAVVEASMARQASVQEATQGSYRALRAVTAGLTRQAEDLRRLADAQKRLQAGVEVLAEVVPPRSRLLH